MQKKKKKKKVLRASIERTKISSTSIVKGGKRTRIGKNDDNMERDIPVIFSATPRLLVKRKFHVIRDRLPILRRIIDEIWFSAVSSVVEIINRVYSRFIIESLDIAERSIFKSVASKNE